MSSAQNFVSRSGGQSIRPAGGPELVIAIDTAEEMRQLGRRVAALVRSSDVILLSGPLGAGKTTLAQGLGAGLGIHEPVVSPTFTIARELSGSFADGHPARLVHVDAYRIGGVEHAPGSDEVTALLDELESLGLDEELEAPSQGTVVLMEWGESMAGILSDERLEIRISRALGVTGSGQGSVGQRPVGERDQGPAGEAASGELTAQGRRQVRLAVFGNGWTDRAEALRSVTEGLAQAFETGR